MVGLIPGAFFWRFPLCALTLWYILIAWAFLCDLLSESCGFNYLLCCVLPSGLPLLLASSSRNTESKKARTICSHFLGLSLTWPEKRILIGEFWFLCNPSAVSVVASAVTRLPWAWDVWDWRMKRGKRPGRSSPQSLWALEHFSPLSPRSRGVLLGSFCPGPSVYFWVFEVVGGNWRKTWETHCQCDGTLNSIFYNSPATIFIFIFFTILTYFFVRSVRFYSLIQLESHGRVGLLHLALKWGLLVFNTQHLRCIWFERWGKPFHNNMERSDMLKKEVKQVTGHFMCYVLTSP